MDTNSVPENSESATDCVWLEALSVVALFAGAMWAIFYLPQYF